VDHVDLDVRRIQRVAAGRLVVIQEGKGVVKSEVFPKRMV